MLMSCKFYLSHGLGSRTIISKVIKIKEKRQMNEKFCRHYNYVHRNTMEVHDRDGYIEIEHACVCRSHDVHICNATAPFPWILISLGFINPISHPRGILGDPRGTGIFEIREALVFGISDMLHTRKVEEWAKLTRY